MNGTDFTAMVLAGAEQLQQHAEHVNSLNVFPVPDGDTGTNMNLTMSAGVTELKRNHSDSIGHSAGVLSKGLLMGARGNSGVITSQLFRGFGRYAAPYDELNAMQFAAALQTGVDAAHKAVVKPVEGTILTVAKEAAKHAVFCARRTNDVTELMEQVLLKAQETLSQTPEMLPVLKQVGVVDSGGQGLVYIYEGFLRYLKGIQGNAEFAGAAIARQAPAAAKPEAASAVLNSAAHAFAERPELAQSKIETEDIEYLYDMEFFINRQLGGQAASFDEDEFRKALSINGDSIIIIADDELIKVHVHSKAPGDVLNLALRYGEITQIHILNMREQHRDLLTTGLDIAPMPELFAGFASTDPVEHSREQAPATPPADELAPYGFIAVASGQGIADIFKSLGVDVVLSGGQTMNPSTEDFVKAIRSISAQHVYILPNNSNIVLAAEQARELLEDERSVTVIPSKSIPQGISAAFAFSEEETSDTNTGSMMDAIARVKSGQVTHAVRDTAIDDINIKAGQYIGIENSKIVTAADSILAACQELLSKMLINGDEIVTVLAGEQTDSSLTAELADWIGENYPDAEVEVHQGGQPVYYYLFSVEP